ncbi:hypothetical protein [Nocardia niigatensis]
MQLTCGIDWSETRHDVALVDETAKVLARRKIDTGVVGFGELLTLIAEHGGSPEQTPIAGAGRPIEPSHTNGRLLKATPDTPGNQDPTTGPNTPGAKR